MAERYIESAEELLRKQQEAEALAASPEAAMARQAQMAEQLRQQQQPAPQQGGFRRLFKRPSEKGFDLDFDKPY